MTTLKGRALRLDTLLRLARWSQGTFRQELGPVVELELALTHA
jgi:hypothetical protein